MLFSGSVRLKSSNIIIFFWFGSVRSGPVRFGSVFYRFNLLVCFLCIKKHTVPNLLISIFINGC